MFRLPFAHRGKKIVAVADIGSDSVGICIAKLNPVMPAQILVSERAILKYEERSKEQIISGILALLGEVCGKIISDYARLQAGKDEATPPYPPAPSLRRAGVRSRLLIGAEPISSAVAVIRTPWSDSKISRVATKFEQEEHITEDVIRELARKALEMEMEGAQTNFFEAAVARIELNGYPTKKPGGKYAHMAEVAVLLSECEPAIYAGVSEILRRTFPGATISIKSGIHAILSLFHEIFPKSTDHFVVDVSGDSTNCIAIRKDIAAEHLSVPLGVRTILKRITGGGMTEEKLALLRMAFRDACSEAACDEINSALSKAEQELARIFGEAFGKLASSRKLPNDLVLIVEPDLAPWMSRFFSRIDFGQFTATTRPFAPRAISEEDMQLSAAPIPGISVETGLAIAAGFVNSEEQER